MKNQLIKIATVAALLAASFASKAESIKVNDWVVGNDYLAFTDVRGFRGVEFGIINNGTQSQGVITQIAVVMNEEKGSTYSCRSGFKEAMSFNGQPVQMISHCPYGNQAGSSELYSPMTQAGHDFIVNEFQTKTTVVLDGYVVSAMGFGRAYKHMLNAAQKMRSNRTNAI